MRPLEAARAERPAAQVGDRRLVDGDQAGARAGLDRHVAHRHPPFHAERADRAAGELDRVAGAAGGADLADDRQHDVLGAAAAAELAVDLHEHVLRLAREQRLRRQHVLDLARADAMGERAERAVGRGVRVAADDGHARQRRALLRADDVDDPLAAIVHLELGDAVAIAVGVERVDLQARDRIGDAVRAIGRRHVVVADGEVGRQAPHLAPGQLEALERLRAGHLVDQVAIDVEQRGAVVLAAHDVLVPDLVVQRARHGRPWREIAIAPF